MVVKVAILVVFFCITIAIGIVSRKKANDVHGFILGGRSVGPWLTAFAYGTSYFSAVVFVGYAGQFGFNFGVAATWIGIGNAIIGSLIPWYLLGNRTRKMTKHLDSKTMPDFFEKRYDSRAIKVISALIIFVFLIPYSASVYNGLSQLFETAFGIDFNYCIIGMAVLTGIYILLGGYMASVINDFIQGIIMLAGIVAVIITVMNKNGGFVQSINLMGDIEGTNGVYASLLGPDPINLLGVVILTSLGTWGLPQMVHKFYAIKDKKAINRGAIISTIFATIVAGGSYFLGGFGRLFVDASTVPAEVTFDRIVPTMLSNIPDLLMGVVIMLVLSASMSTLSSLVLSSSSTFTVDFIKGFLCKNLSEKAQMVVIKVMVVVFVAISAVIALVPGNPITTLMSWSWGALAGAFLGPFLYGLWSKKTTKGGVWASFITGIGITIIGFVLSLCKVKLTGPILGYFNSPINIGAFSMIVSLIIVPLVSLVTPKLRKEVVDDAFSCLDTKDVE